MSTTFLILSNVLPVCINEKTIKFLLILCSTKSMFHLRVLAWFVCVNTAIMHDRYISEQKNNIRGYNVPCSLTRVHYCTHARTRYMYMLKLTFFYVYLLRKLLQISGYLDLHSSWRCYYVALTESIYKIR